MAFSIIIVTFISFALAPTIAVTFSGVPHLHTLIAEYEECVSVIYIFSTEKTDYNPTSVPVYITTNKAKTDNEWIPMINAGKFLMACVLVFYIFPERLQKETEWQRRITGLERNSRQILSGMYSYSVTGHIFSADWNTIMHTMQETSYTSSVLLLFHHQTLQTSHLNNTNMIWTSFIKFGLSQSLPPNDFTASLPAPFRLIPLDGTEIGSVRRVIEENSLRIFNNNRFYSFTKHSEMNRSNLLSIGRIISNTLGSPFSYALNVKRSESLYFEFHRIVQLLCGEMLDMWMENDIITESSGWLRWDIRDPSGPYLPDMLLHSIGNLKSLYSSEYIVGLVPTGFEFMNFVTCDGVSVPVSFEFYINPYDFGSWLTFLVLVILIIPLVLVLFENGIRLLTGNDVRLFGQIVQFVLSSTLEVSPSIPSEYKFRRETKGILGLWLILVVTLTNAYKGIVVSDLTSNRPEAYTWTNVTDMSGFTYVLSQDVTDELNFGKEIQNAVGGYEKVALNLRSCGCFPEDQEFISDFCIKMNQDLRDYPEEDLKKCTNLSSHLVSGNIMLPQTFKINFCSLNDEMQPFIDSWRHDLDAYLAGLLIFELVMFSNPFVTLIF